MVPMFFSSHTSFRFKMKFILIILILFCSFFPIIESSAYLSSSQMSFSSSNLTAANSTPEFKSSVSNFLSSSSQSALSSISSATLNFAFSVLFGGSGFYSGYSIALDSTHTIYIAGTTNSTNFPLKMLIIVLLENYMMPLLLNLARLAP